jgi:hypothetical protein
MIETIHPNTSTSNTFGTRGRGRDSASSHFLVASDVSRITFPVSATFPEALRFMLLAVQCPKIVQLRQDDMECGSSMPLSRSPARQPSNPQALLAAPDFFVRESCVQPQHSNAASPTSTAFAAIKGAPTCSRLGAGDGYRWLVYSTT